MDTKRLRLRDVVLLALCLAACQTPPTTEAAESLTLVQTLIVSRHSIRTPMAAPFSDVGDISAYSTRKWPSAADWGMTQKEVDNQYLTPRGIEVARLTGEFYRETFNSGASTPSPISSVNCDQVTVFSDGGAYRDFQTAQAWLQGFGCPAPEETNIIQINQSSLPTMQPVVATAFQIDGCSSASEEQVNGTYGGNVAALTARFAASIQKVQDVLQMPTNASICTQVNRTFEPSASHPCTLFELGYAWNGVLWDGMFYSPLVYAQYFAEAWMLQYLSNVTQWAWGALSSNELVELYKMHIQSLWFGTNEWTSRAYGSQLLAYVLASLNAAATGRHVVGLEHEPSQKLVAFFSHDANILYLQRLLGMSWLTTGWPFDVATTASSLRFELLRGTTGKLFVRVAYVSASPDQQRSATSFVHSSANSSGSSSATPLSVAYVVLPQCGSLLCPLDEFQDAVLAAVDTDCMIGDTQRYALDLIAAQEPSIMLTALVTGACVMFAMSVPLIVIVARTYNGGCGLGKPATAMSRGHRGVSRNSSRDSRRVATRRTVGRDDRSSGAEAPRPSTSDDATNPSDSRRRSTRSSRSSHTRRLSSRTPTGSSSADLLLTGSAAQTWPADADVVEQGAANVQRRQADFDGAGSEGASAGRGYRGTRAPSGEFGGLTFDRNAARERSRTRSTGSRGGSVNRLLAVPMAQSFSSSAHSNEQQASHSEIGRMQGASGADLA